MESKHRAQTGTPATVYLRLLLTFGVLVLLSGAVYLPEDGPPLPLTDSGQMPAEPRNPTDDNVLTVIPGKIKPPPSLRVPNWPVHSLPRYDGCLDALFTRTKRDARIQVTETEDAVITDIVHTKPQPVRQIIRQPSQSIKFVCPQAWRGLDLTDPSVIECPENATGFFPFPPDCRKYLNCWRGRSTVQPCAPATYFDPVRRECDYPEKVKCLPDCYSGKASDHSVSSQNSEFDESGSNNGNHHDEFDNGIGGDGDTQSPGGSEGFGARNPVNHGTPRPPGGYHDLSHDNQGTVIDDYGVDPTLYVDPNDPLAHSPLLDVRDLPKGKVLRARPNSGTQPRTHAAHNQSATAGQREHPNSRPRRYVYTLTSSKYCPMEGGTGLAPDPDDCSRFYNCAQGRAYRQDCSAGTLFSDRLVICDHSHLVNCGSRPRHRSQSRIPSPPEFSSHDSHSAGSFRQEVQVPYPQPTKLSFPTPTGRNINVYQPIPPRNPDTGYRPNHDYHETPIPSQTPRPVFFRPKNYQNPGVNHPSPESFQHNHPSNEPSNHNHRPNEPFHHNHPPHQPFNHNHRPNEPFHHNHPPHETFNSNYRPNEHFHHNQPQNVPYQHNHPPNTQFHHNHPPPQSPYFQHNHPTFKPNYPTRNPPSYVPPQYPHNSPPFNTALDPNQSHSSYNPKKENPIIPEQNPVHGPSKDGDNYDQSPQASNPFEDRFTYGSSSTPKSVDTGNRWPKSDPRGPENNLSRYPVNPRDPQAREDRWNIPPETEESPTLCPTTNEPVEGAADRDAWMDLVNKTRNARTPMAGQWVRLRGGRSSLEGQVEILGPGAAWGGVCDAEGAWNIEKASIVCKQLGFERGAETAWQGGSSLNKPTHVNSVTCGEGAPSLLHCALQRGWDEYSCDTLTSAVYVRCLPNWSSKCQPGETLRGDRCYRLFKPTVDMTDLAQSASEAVEHCRSRGGHIVDVNSQAENDFLTDWLATEHPDVDAILTSGIGVQVKDPKFLTRDLWVWQTDNYSPMGFSKWWPGWNSTRVTTPSVGDRTVCVVLKKSYPCDGRRNEMCSADYMYWDAVDCAQRGTLYPYICERKGDDIGCVDGTSEYKGTANVTANGRPCLPWDDERVVSAMRYRVTEQNRRETLNGHNYCRKVYGNREPWCYVDYGRGIEIRPEDCQIPPCWDRGTTTNNTANQKVGSETDSDDFWQPSNPAKLFAIPWQYASNYPHMEYAAYNYQDNDTESTVRPEQDQGLSDSDIETTADIPNEYPSDSNRPSAGREYDRALMSTTIKPASSVPAPIVSPKATWSLPRKNRNERFTTTPAPTKEPGQADETSALSAFDEIFGSPTPAQSSDQYFYTYTPPSAGIQTVGEVPYFSRGPKSPHVFQNPQYPKIRQYTQRPPNAPYQGLPDIDPQTSNVTPPNPTNSYNRNPEVSQYSGPQTLQYSYITQRPQSSPRPNVQEIPLDVDDAIPDEIVNNPVMPPSYPDGRPPIPSDEKPPITNRGGFPKATTSPEQQGNVLRYEKQGEEFQNGETSFNDLLRILHQRYGKPNPPQYYNGHTGPMSWYNPLMINPTRNARSPGDDLPTPLSPFFRLDANESKYIMKIPPHQPREKGSDRTVPRYYM